MDQDRCSYDADGSEESIDDNETETVPEAESTFHGSTESVYYSTWTLDEKTDAQLKTDGLKPDSNVDSYFVSGLVDSPLTDVAGDALEEFQDCRGPDTVLCQQLNPRFSWPVGLGDRLAAIWGEQELQSSQVCTRLLV